DDDESESDDDMTVTLHMCTVGLLYQKLLSDGGNMVVNSITKVFNKASRALSAWIVPFVYSLIYVPPPFAAAAIMELLEAELDLIICSDSILPLSPAAMAFPPLSIRGTLGATKLLRPFSEVVDFLGLKDPFIRNLIDLLSFLLAGVKSDGVLSAEMIYMFAE
ncbi:hypothetical protein Tco_1433431, partial [Tanacetum coccineum]